MYHVMRRMTRTSQQVRRGVLEIIRVPEVMTLQAHLSLLYNEK